MKTGWKLMAVGLVLCCSFSIGLCGDHDWNYFVFSRWWPQSQCYYQDNMALPEDYWRFTDIPSRNNCVPADVTTWTIHGLWPTIGGEPKPVMCNHSWPFRESEIEDLEPKLMQQWLTLPDATKSSSLKLWIHEWTKHGTCCTDLPPLSSEHRYFSMAMALNGHYDLLSGLTKQGIHPSDDKTYSVGDVEEALSKLYGAKGRVICLDGPDDQQLLAGVRICLDKSFKTRDCIQTKAEHCRYDDPLGYPTIIRQETPA